MSTPLTLPALRGTFGSWVYYVCTVPVAEIGDRVRYAEEVHPDKALSELIQRRLTGARAKHIAEYLAGTPDRFFNSLVLATYGGSPEWMEIGNFRAPKDPTRLALLTDQARDGLGFLLLSGKEKIFALDGQHRLAGIRQALEDDMDFGDDMLPVLLVAHKTTKAGKERTRRLFTTLNKTAIAVQKADIIALDEDDAMAIIARRLVEEDPAFRSPRTAVISSLNMPATNRTALMTIATLYDVLKLLFMHHIGKRSDRTLRFNRPSDDKLKEYHALAVAYFAALASAFPPIAAVRRHADPATITLKNRDGTGGHLLFRAIGLDILTRTAIERAKKDGSSLPAAVARLKDLPMDLSSAPWSNVIWKPSSGTIHMRGKTLGRRIMFYLAGLLDADDVLEEYRAFLDRPRAKLPNPILTD